MRGRFLRLEEDFKDTSEESFYMKVDENGADDIHGGYYINFSSSYNSVELITSSQYHSYIKGKDDGKINSFEIVNYSNINKSPLSNEFTIEFWVKITGYNSYYNDFSLLFYDIGYDTNKIASTYRFSIYENYFMSTINIEDNKANYSESYYYSQNSWYHIAVVLDNNQLRFYVNGKQLTGSQRDLEIEVTSVQLKNILGSIGYYVEVCELRISKGVKYKPNFTPTPPTPELPND